MSERIAAVHRSNIGCWEAVIGLPHPALRPFLRGGYSGWSEPAPVVRREVPVPMVPVILDFASGWSIANDGEARSKRLSSFAAGAHDRATLVESAGAAACLQFNLTHEGAYRLLRLPMHELANRSVDLIDLLGSPGARLIDALGNEDDWSRRFDLLDAFLIERLLPGAGLSPAVAFVLQRIERAAGMEAIGALARDAGTSAKRLIAGFRAEVGLPPKTVARIHRFHHAARRLKRGEASLAAIALDSGYCDQAHFNREFRALAGISPLQYLAARPTGDEAMPAG